MATKGTKKSATKQLAAKKKAAAKKVDRDSSLPSQEFTADLDKLFKKHGFAGLPQHMSFATADVCDRICPDGSKATPTWINCKDGTTKMVCTCPGEDPSCN